MHCKPDLFYDLFTRRIVSASAASGSGARGGCTDRVFPGPCEPLARTAPRCAGQEDAPVSPGTSQLSSSLRTLLLPKMERGSRTAAGSSRGTQDSTITLLVAPARIHDTVESCRQVKWWQGEAPKSHPKFKMLHYSLSNATSSDGECRLYCSLCLHDISVK